MSKQGLPTYSCYIYNSQFGETVPLSVTATSGSVAFALVASAKNAETIITNAGTKIAFVNFGLAANGAVVATVPGTNGTTGAFPVLPGAIYTMQKNAGDVNYDTCAAICGGSDTTTLYFTSVQGS